MAHSNSIDVNIWNGNGSGFDCNTEGDGNLVKRVHFLTLWQNSCFVAWRNHITNLKRRLVWFCGFPDIQTNLGLIDSVSLALQKKNKIIHSWKSVGSLRRINGVVRTPSWIRCGLSFLFYSRQHIKAALKDGRSQMVGLGSTPDWYSASHKVLPLSIPFNLFRAPIMCIDIIEMQSAVSLSTFNLTVSVQWVNASIKGSKILTSTQLSTFLLVYFSWAFHRAMLRLPQASVLGFLAFKDLLSTTRSVQHSLAIALPVWFLVSSRHRCSTTTSDLSSIHLLRRRWWALNHRILS